MVDTVFNDGKYFSIFVLGVHKTTHSSAINLKPVTFSVPALFRSPILGLFFFGSGHSVFGSSGISGISELSTLVSGGFTSVGGFASSISCKSFLLY